MVLMRLIITKQWKLFTVCRELVRSPYIEHVASGLPNPTPGSRPTGVTCTTLSLRMSDIYRLCDKIDHGALLDVSVFFYNLAVNFGNVVQYNKVNRTMEVRCQMSRLMTKPTKWSVRPAKTQISLGIHPVWSVSSPCAQWVAKDPLHADSEDSDQTGLMIRLIWVFAGRTIILLGLSWGGSNANNQLYFEIFYCFEGKPFEHVNSFQ